jgi:putative SOS response-associated peptidase YedK
MCGRYTLTVDPSELMKQFDLKTADFATTPRYNIAPTQDVAVVYDESPTTLSSARWGLIPSWSKDPSIGSRMINARAETLDEKPSFRGLLKKKRCLILADSLYEWKKNDDGTKTPMRIMLKNGEPFAFAGLWDVWKMPETGDWLKTCTIVTGAPNELVAPIHDRMAVILTKKNIGEWMNKANDDPIYLKSLLAPFAASKMKAYAVSPRVNNVRNDDARLIEPLA